MKRFSFEVIAKLPILDELVKSPKTVIPAKAGIYK
jgi:hypothetical protein